VNAAAPLRLTREAAPASEDVQAISDGLDAYNAKFLPGYDLAPKPRHIVGRDTDGVVCAGVRFWIGVDWAMVEWLWVAEAHRGAGVGKKLLGAVEAEARENNCRGVYLDTFSFQAPNFYARFGYGEFGRVRDCPAGFDRIWLQKRFA